MPDWTDDPKIRLRQLLLVIGVTRSTLYRMMETGRFPLPRREENRYHLYWRQSQVLAFIEHRDEC